MRDRELWKRHNEQLYKMLPIIIEESQRKKEPWSETMRKVDTILDKINDNRRKLGEIQ